MTRLLLLIMTLTLLSLPTLADTGVPFVGAIDQSIFDSATILVHPDGSGPPLSEARSHQGTVDATIRVMLVDLYFYPIPLFPSEDLWIQFEVGEGTATGCIQYQGFEGGVFLADQATDIDGWTEFALPLRGGGWSNQSVTVYLNGSPAMDPYQSVFPPLPLGMVSPDITGDLVVNLSDIAIFTQDLHHHSNLAHPRSDFNNDTVVNLVDITLMVQAAGTACD